MSLKEQKHGGNKASPKQQSPKPAIHAVDAVVKQQIHPATIVQRTKLDPSSLTPRDVLQLQRMLGNQATGPATAMPRPGSVIQRALSLGEVETLTTRAST